MAPVSVSALPVFLQPPHPSPVALLTLRREVAGPEPRRSFFLLRNVEIDRLGLFLSSLATGLRGATDAMEKMVIQIVDPAFGALPYAANATRGADRPQVECLETRLVPSASVLTYHNDGFNDGQNLNETVLTPATSMPPILASSLRSL